MKYSEWVLTVPKEFTGDSLWKIEAYRLSLFVADVGWFDVTKLMRDKRTLDLSSQLYESLGSMGVNLAEGYSRGSNKDRARFYEYSLGSARESRDWYYKGRHVLGDEVTFHRVRLLTQIIRLLLTMIPDERGRTLHEDRADYRINSSDALADEKFDRTLLDSLLENVPLPPAN